MKPRTFLFAMACASTGVVRAQITNNLLSYWDFEGNANNNAAASGGSTYNGVLSGNAVASGGLAKSGTGMLNLDGAGDFMTVNSLLNLNQSWTISAWFKSDIVPTTGRHFVFESYNSAAPNTGYGMSYGLRDGTTGNTNFQTFTDLTGSDLSDDTQVPDSAATNWHHIVLSYTAGGNLVGYLNGVQDANIAIPNGTFVSADRLRIGTYRTADSRYFDGSIDEVAIWNSNVTAADAYWTYNLGDRGFALSTPERVKSDNLTALNVGGSWTGGAAPTALEVMTFSSAYTQSTALGTGADLSVAGLRVIGGSGLIEINGSGGYLETGVLGIDLSASGRNLSVENLRISATQRWNIGAGATFTAGTSSLLSGTHGIEKLGSGTAIIQGTGTYTGGTRIAAGILEAQNGSAIGDSSNVTFDNVSGATLRLAANETVGSISGGGTTGGHINLQSFALTTGANNSNATYAGNISGTGGSLIKSGTGILTLSGTNTHTGGTFINAGALSIATTGALPGFSTNGSLAVASGATLAVQNAVTDADITSLLGTTNFAAGSSLGFDTTVGNRTYATTLTDTSQGSLRITKLGANVLTLSTANSYTGGTSINAGRINVGNNTALGSGAITVGGDTSYGATYASGGSPFLVMTSTSAATLANDIILANPTSTRYYALQKLAASSTTGTNLELSGTISGGGANMIFQLDSATAGDSTTSFTLSGNNTLSGQIRLNRGAIILTNANSLGTASLFVQTNANNTDGNVRFTNSFTLANNITIGVNANNSFNTGENNIVLSGVISGTGTWGKVGGSGKLTMTNTNTATGAITLSSGTLSLGSTGSLFSTGAFFGVSGTTYVTVNAGATMETRRWTYGAGNALNELRANSASVRVDGGIIRFTESFSSTRGFQVGANGATLEATAGVTYTKLAGSVGGDNIIQGVGSAGSLTLTGTGNGVIEDGIGSTGSWSASAGITKSGTGTWTLTGDNTYTGDTTVTSGTLAIGSTGSLGNTTTTIGINGNLTGGGTIGGTTTIAGFHTPGFSPGTQTFTNGLSYASTATLVWELTANTTSGRGTNYDAINVTAGNFSLTNGALMNLVFGENIDFSQSFWQSDQEWLVIDLSGTATADDSNVFAIGIINGGVNYDPSLGSFGVQRKDGSTSADAVYLTWTAVPEPSSSLLSLLGISGLLLRRRR